MEAKVNIVGVKEVESVKKNVICGMCPGGCAVEVKLLNGKLIEIVPDKNVPFGTICTRRNKGSQIISDFKNSSLIVIWGANPVTDSPPFKFHETMKAKRDGKRILTIDHMKSDMPLFIHIQD